MTTHYKGLIPTADGAKWCSHVQARSRAEAFALIVKQCQESPAMADARLDCFSPEDVIEVADGSGAALSMYQYWALSVTPLGRWLSRRSVWQLKAILFCLRLAMIGVLAGPVLLVAWMLYAAH